MKKWAVEWEKAGHVVFPLRAGGKQPRVKWRDDSLCHTDYRAEDWAVRCDKITVIDYDKGKKDYDEGWIPAHGGAGHEQATKNGVHRIFSYEDEVKRTADPAGARGVDIKTGSGSYIKIYGPPPRALVALPASLKSVLSKKAARCNKLLRALSPDCARDKWLPIVTAIRGVLGKDGLAVAYAWSRYSAGTNHQGHEEYNEFVGRYEGLANWGTDECWRLLGGDFNLPTWTLKTYEDVEIKDAKWILEDVLPVGELTLLTGEPGVGKTRAALTIAVTQALGKRLSCYPKEQEPSGKPVLFWGPENDDSTVVAPIVRHFGADKLVYRPAGTGFSMGNPRCVEQLQSWMRSGDISMVILDPLYDMARGVKNDHSLIDITERLEGLNKVAQETGVSIIGIMHTPKGARSRSLLERTSGSLGWIAKARMALIMQRTNGTYRSDGGNDEQGSVSILLKQKNSKGNFNGGLFFTIEPTHVGTLSRRVGISRCIGYEDGLPQDLDEKYVGEKVDKTSADETTALAFGDMKQKLEEDGELVADNNGTIYYALERTVAAEYMQEAHKIKVWKLDKEGVSYGLHKFKTKGIYYIGVKKV